MKTAEEYRREMESYFGEGKGDEARRPDERTNLAEERGISLPVEDVPTRPELRLHDYKREPKKAVIAEGLFKQQKGLCAEGAVREGFLEKYVKNNIVIILIGLGNLAITTAIITGMSLLWRSSWLFAPTVYYLTAQVFSIQYSVLFNRNVRTRMVIFGREYRFNEHDKP